MRSCFVVRSIVRVRLLGARARWSARDPCYRAAMERLCSSPSAARRPIVEERHHSVGVGPESSFRRWGRRRDRASLCVVECGHRPLVRVRRTRATRERLAFAKMPRERSLHGLLSIVFVRLLAQRGCAGWHHREAPPGAQPYGRGCHWRAVTVTGRHSGLPCSAVWGRHVWGPTGFARRADQGGPALGLVPCAPGTGEPSRMT